MSLLLLPLLLIIGIFLIILNQFYNPGRLLFIQERMGRNCEIFNAIKFRSMSDVKEITRKYDDPIEVNRITPLGSLIRKLRIDELPQILNVLKGDMSLVGPRPLLVEYLSLYSSKQARRHEVKPGITGWAQVNGRNAITWAEKFDFDVWYVDNKSILLDIKILWLTIKKVIMREGINQDRQATMEKFKGNNEEN